VRFEPATRFPPTPTLLIARALSESGEVSREKYL
jgi:hypothetical protein